jgi:hypothetical protein
MKMSSIKVFGTGRCGRRLIANRDPSAPITEPVTVSKP